MSDSKDDLTSCSAGDVLVLGPNVPGGTAVIRHKPDHSIQEGVILPLEDGKPIPPNAEIVTLEHVEGDEYRVTESSEATKGPAKVTSNAYRSGWDAIFGTEEERLLLELVV